MEDKKIIELFYQRNERAIEAAAEKYGAYCRSIAIAVLENHESSEECVADTWLRAWGAIPPQRPAVLRAFLGKITRNLALSRLRSEKREKRGGGQPALALGELSESIPDARTPERVLEDREITAAINAWLGTLPREHRIAFLRRYWYFDSLSELAAHMAWPQGKTNSLLVRLRASLRRYLEQEGISL